MLHNFNTMQNLVKHITIIRKLNCIQFTKQKHYEAPWIFPIIVIVIKTIHLTVGSDKCRSTSGFSCFCFCFCCCLSKVSLGTSLCTANSTCLPWPTRVVDCRSPPRSHYYHSYRQDRLYPPPILPSKIRPLKTEGAVGVYRNM